VEEIYKITFYLSIQFPGVPLPPNKLGSDCETKCPVPPFSSRSACHAPLDRRPDLRFWR
jgi:hypothetical protein